MKDEIIEKLLAYDEMHTIPYGAQATAIHVFEQFIDELMEDKPYATLQSIFGTTDDDTE